MMNYKVLEAKSSAEAERVMNDMAKQGWVVKQVTYWINWSNRLVITFEREY